MSSAFTNNPDIRAGDTVMCPICKSYCLFRNYKVHASSKKHLANLEKAKQKGVTFSADPVKVMDGDYGDEEEDEKVLPEAAEIGEQAPAEIDEETVVMEEFDAIHDSIDELKTHVDQCFAALREELIRVLTQSKVPSQPSQPTTTPISEKKEEKVETISVASN